MSDSNTLLRQVADVLEKAASYFEEVETKKVAAETNARKTAASELAEKLTEATGEQVEPGVVEKLSALDPEISKFLGKIAGENSSVDSMGGPREKMQKTAAAGGDPVGERFLDWITGP